MPFHQPQPLCWNEYLEKEYVRCREAELTDSCPQLWGHTNVIKKIQIRTHSDNMLLDEAHAQEGRGEKAA